MTVVRLSSFGNTKNMSNLVSEELAGDDLISPGVTENDAFKLQLKGIKFKMKSYILCLRDQESTAISFDEKFSMNTPGIVPQSHQLSENLSNCEC